MQRLAFSTCHRPIATMKFSAFALAAVAIAGVNGFSAPMFAARQVRRRRKTKDLLENENDASVCVGVCHDSVERRRCRLDKHRRRFRLSASSSSISSHLSILCFRSI